MTPPDMPVELNARLISLLDYIGTTVKSAEGFALEHAPDIAQQMVYWGIAKGAAGLLWVIILMIISFIGFIKIVKMYKNKETNEELLTASTVMMGLVLILIWPATLAGAFPVVSEGLQALIAPKLYLLNEIKDFIK